jgi:hypothetical protein
MVVLSIIQELAQLAVLATAAVDTVLVGLELIEFLLAGNAKANSFDRLASRLGNIVAAFFAVGKALTRGQAAACQFYRIFDAGVDLFLHRAIACPASGHGVFPVIYRG